MLNSKNNSTNSSAINTQENQSLLSADIAYNRWNSPFSKSENTELPEGVFTLSLENDQLHLDEETLEQEQFVFEQKSLYYFCPESPDEFNSRKSSDRKKNDKVMSIQVPNITNFIYRLS